MSRSGYLDSLIQSVGYATLGTVTGKALDTLLGKPTGNAATDSLSALAQFGAGVALMSELTKFLVPEAVATPSAEIMISVFFYLNQPHMIHKLDSALRESLESILHSTYSMSAVSPASKEVHSTTAKPHHY
jgi:hypothetical protein